MLNYTFIFIGCGLSDPDIRIVLENTSFNFPGGPKHFFVTPRLKIDDNLISSIEKQRNIEFIQYDEIDGHRELHEGIESLVKMVEERRDEIAARADW